MLIDLHAHTSGISRCCKVTAQQVLEEAKKRNMGIIAVTHNKYLAQRISDRVYDLSKQDYV